MTIDWSEGLPFMIGPYEVGLTETSPETAGYWEGVAAGELRIKRCANCGRHLHPRRIFCPQCSSHDLQWLKASGEGVVYTFSTVHRAPSAEFEAPYTNGIVELAEGVHLFGRLIGKDHAQIAIGDAVTVEFGPVRPGGDRLPLYRVR
jgi:uncharacterized protein